MALTRRYGKNPHLWFENTEFYMEKMDEAEFYKDSVVRYGPFGGTETLRYVPYVLDTYTRFVEKGLTKAEKEKLLEKNKKTEKDSVVDKEKTREKDTLKNTEQEKKTVPDKETEPDKNIELEKETENNEQRNHSD